MKLILCVDVDNGMTFNDRRQSRDREVIKDIVRYVGKGRIFISEYSRNLFEGANANVVISDINIWNDINAKEVVSDFEKEETIGVVYETDKTEVEINDDNLRCKNDKTDEEFCFIEKIEHLNKINWNKVDEMILYRWDKKYPADCSFYVDNDKFRLNNILEFQGYSHDKITREVYEKYEG